MSIQLLSTNVGELQSIPGAKKKAKTGIFKLPVEGSVAVRANGLEGDHIGSKKYHGGPDQAIYIYSAEDYAWWEQTLIGEVLLELSAPRIPCATLAARLEEPTLVKQFAQANRGGTYARVLQPRQHCQRNVGDRDSDLTAPPNYR